MNNTDTETHTYARTRARTHNEMLVHKTEVEGYRVLAGWGRRAGEEAAVSAGVVSVRRSFRRGLLDVCTQIYCCPLGPPANKPHTLPEHYNIYCLPIPH